MPSDPTDPFRPLDRLDPPDQWADIAARADRAAEALDRADPVAPDHRRRRATVLGLAAAIALVAGGLVTLGGDDDGRDDVVAGPDGAEEITGPCPFSLEPGPDVPVLEDGPWPDPADLPPLPPELADRIRQGSRKDGTSQAHGTVGDLTVSISLGPYTESSSGLATRQLWHLLSPYADGGLSMGVADARYLDGDPDCVHLIVRVHIPFEPGEEPKPSDEFEDADESEVTDEEYAARADPILDAVLDAVRFPADAVGPAPTQSTTDPHDPPAGVEDPPDEVEGELADGTPFTAFESEDQGLCLRVAGNQVACDMDPGIDPTIARLVRPDDSPPIWFGMLPPDGVEPYGVSDSDPTGQPHPFASGRSPFQSGRIWAIPVEPTPSGDVGRVIYRLQDGTEVPAPTA